MTDDKESLPQALRDLVEQFRKWAESYLRSEQGKNTITDALYHYTDGSGLRGILDSGRIWFTDYRHLNDPSELLHGIETVGDVSRGMANGADERVQHFLRTLTDMFQHPNLEKSLDFFIASFSREGDDLGQWRAYADNGRG